MKSGDSRVRRVSEERRQQSEHGQWSGVRRQKSEEGQWDQETAEWRQEEGSHR